MAVLFPGTHDLNGKQGTFFFSALYQDLMANWILDVIGRPSSLIWDMDCFTSVLQGVLLLIYGWKTLISKVEESDLAVLEEVQANLMLGTKLGVVAFAGICSNCTPQAAFQSTTLGQCYPEEASGLAKERSFVLLGRIWGRSSWCSCAGGEYSLGVESREPGRKESEAWNFHRW